MAACALALFIFLNIVSEKIPLGNGLGYDGVNYAFLARNFDKILEGSLHLDSIYYNRFLPSLLCRFTLLSLGLPLSDHNIIVFFSVLNLFLLSFCAWLWSSLTLAKGFSDLTRWFGFVALFFSHASLKYNIYYATLTDISALFLGTLMLWAYLRNSNLVLIAALIAGTATWPTLPILGVILLILPPRNFDAPPAPGKSVLLVTWILGGSLWFLLSHGLAPIEESIYPLLGGGLACVLLAIALFHLFNAQSFFSLNTPPNVLRAPRLIIGGAALIGAPLCLWALTGYRVDLPHLIQAFFFQVLRLGMKRPGEFFVAHVLYYGPWVLLLALTFPEAARAARRAGPGLVILTAVTLVQALSPLSRQLIASMPFFVFLCAAALDRAPLLTPRFLTWFCVLSALFSKVWMRFSADQAAPSESFCFDWYVSSTGCWMPFTMYWVQGLLVLFLLFTFWILWRRTQPEKKSSYE